MYGLFGERHLGDVGYGELFRQLVRFIGKLVREFKLFKLFKFEKLIFKQLVELDKYFKHLRLDKFNDLIKQCRKLVGGKRLGSAEQHVTRRFGKHSSKLVKRSAAARGQR